MILITLWIKFVSKGPVFFYQERIGLGGERFLILKFRSMKVNSETSVHEAYVRHLIHSGARMEKLDRTGDKRLIPFGALIRALGLDELPQIINVVRGDMSLVGPRPCTPQEFEHYEPAQRNRVNVPPGLTGNWQINGKNKTTFAEMIELDLTYAKEMSLRRDVAIMLWTFPVLLKQAAECLRPVRPRTESAPQPMISEQLLEASQLQQFGSGIRKL
jgi:exopolysaccharide production protein ExoY